MKRQFKEVERNNTHERWPYDTSTKRQNNTQATPSRVCTTSISGQAI
jgi:hypothetical protein